MHDMMNDVMKTVDAERKRGIAASERTMVENVDKERNGKERNGGTVMMKAKKGWKRRHSRKCSWTKRRRKGKRREEKDQGLRRKRNKDGEL